jgi:LEA14-like dessication related protein
MPDFLSSRKIIALLVMTYMLLTSCASLPGIEPPRVSVAGIESLDGQGMEMRFNVKLRIQNPNNTPIKYQGLLADLFIDGRRVASGVSNEPGLVPAYGELVYTLPVTVSTLNVIRQLIDIAQQPQKSAVRYEIKGKLEGGLFGTVRFSDNGNLTLPK